MTELEQLKQDIENSTWELEFKDENEFYKMLSDKYSITLRNSDSSADNNKVEQSTTDEELVSKIENMALNLAEIYSDEMLYPEIKASNGFWHFKDELRNLFKTHRNTVSSAVNQKDDNLVDEDELVDKIAKIVFQVKENVKSQSFQISCNNFAEEIVKLFKTYQNSVLRQDLNQMNKYSSRGETESKIAFKNSLRFSIGQMVTADQELDQIVENIVKFFIDTVNPVFKALNDSGE